MQLTIVGAGGIGGVTGAHLIRAGHDVTFVDTAEDHVARMNEAGLRIEGYAASSRFPCAPPRPPRSEDRLVPWCWR
jgi:2-dehydropantoate 2-reductase